MQFYLYDRSKSTSFSLIQRGKIYINLPFFEVLIYAFKHTLIVISNISQIIALLWLDIVRLFLHTDKNVFKDVKL